MPAALAAGWGGKEVLNCVFLQTLWNYSSWETCVFWIIRLPAFAAVPGGPGAGGDSVANFKLHSLSDHWNVAMATQSSAGPRHFWASFGAHVELQAVTVMLPAVLGMDGFKLTKCISSWGGVGLPHHLGWISQACWRRAVHAGVFSQALKVAGILIGLLLCAYYELLGLVCLARCQTIFLCSAAFGSLGLINQPLWGKTFLPWEQWTCWGTTSFRSTRGKQGHSWRDRN